MYFDLLACVDVGPSDSGSGGSHVIAVYES